MGRGGGRCLGGALALALAVAPAVAGEDTPQRADRIVFDEKGLMVSSPDESVVLRLGGRLHVDPGLARTNPKGVLDIQDVAVRRAWVETSLTIEDRFEAAFQYDLSDRRTPVNDAALAYRGLKPLLVTLGNVKEPFSLQQLASNNDTTFVERGLPDALVPARNVGLALGANGERWTLAGGVFGGNVNTGVERGGVAGTVRATYAPILEARAMLHLGVAGSLRSYDRDARAPSFDSQPEAFDVSSALLDTSAIREAASLARLGLEAAYQQGPWRVQAEYVLATVERRGGRPSVTFSGAYVEAAILLDGEGRRYALAPDYGASYAVFKGVEVPEAKRVSRGGFGVFELAGRFSFLDLKDAEIRGGLERDWTAGLNWYPDRNIRLMANYIRAHAEGSPLATRAVDADIGEFRIQLYW